MSEDWRGEHLIRGIRSSHADRASENNRCAHLIARINGKFTVPEKIRRNHSAFTRSVLRSAKQKGKVE